MYYRTICGFLSEKGDKIVYPNRNLTVRPSAARSDEQPIKTCTTFNDISTLDVDYHPPSTKEPQFITQVELNDFVRDLQLSKRQGQLLVSRLQAWNVFDDNRVSVSRN